MEIVYKISDLNLVPAFRRTPCRQHRVLPQIEDQSIKFEINSSNYCPNLSPTSPSPHCAQESKKGGRGHGGGCLGTGARADAPLSAYAVEVAMPW